MLIPMKTYEEEVISEMTDLLQTDLCTGEHWEQTLYTSRK